ncbi:MAG: chemotaxis-specific protein-glutamate methyltransferase CheB [Magnetococcales bacterium]|nr:chemotaxis-specific protein-glutamate methyltransferase CheB [Magnetococcales bacterium]
MIRVVLVDDSPVALRILQTIIEADGDIVVAASAADGVLGWQCIQEVHPDVVCTDFYMPNMNGLSLVKTIMSQSPLPILVISVLVEENNDSETILLVLQAGAMDILAKPPGGPTIRHDRWGRQLRQKIRALSNAKPLNLMRRSFPVDAAVVSPSKKAAATITGSIVVLGASTGGPLALTRILQALPGDFSWPIICVQHIGSAFLPGLVAWLGKTTTLPVVHAKTGDCPRPGTIYFPPPGADLSVKDTGQFYCHPHDPGQEAVNTFSIDLTFQSLAHHFRNSVLGILLTGMGSDGARGLLEIDRQGGTTIAQDEASSVVFGMPQQAIALGAAQKILPLDSIPGAVLTWCKTGRLSC